MSHRSAALFLLAGSLGVVAQGEIMPVAGQQDESHLAGPDAEQESYPDGSRWPGGELEKAQGRVPSEELNGSSLADPDSWLGTLVQGRLPAELRLSEGVATRVMSDPANAGNARIGAAEKWFVVYPLHYRGIRVAKYSDALAVVSAGGEVLYVRKRNVPALVDAAEPTVSAGQASAVARKQAEEAFGPVQLEESPPELEIWVEPSLAGRLAWTLTIESTSLTDLEARRYWVAAAGQPQVLQAENLVYHGHFGTVSATTWETSPFHPTSNHALPEVRLTRTPGGAVQVTGLDGRYGYPDGRGRAAITSALAGPRCVVKNQSGAGMVTAGSGVPRRPVDLSFTASGELETAQTSAFFWANATYQLARSILDPLPGSPFANLTANVNVAKSCDAVWKEPTKSQEQSINFHVAGRSEENQCPNTAYSDVVAHEYGHGVDFWRGKTLHAGYSEGFGDTMALLLTRQPCMGRDFFGTGTCLRSAKAVNNWPPLRTDGPHAQGKRYAQFVWESVQQLKKTLSEEESFRLAGLLVLAAAAANPSCILDAVRLGFIADDDDGDLANGTPHCKELVDAAGSRKIPVPALLACPRNQLPVTIR